MSPFYYYAAGVIRINWYVVAMSSLADVLPAQWRAPSFDILSAGYSVGQALSPRLALWLGYLMVSLWSLLTMLLGIIIVVLFIPETLGEETRHQARLQRSERQVPWWYRPLWELTILKRTFLFRMLSSLAFFSGMVSSADYTLLVYYLQEHLSFTDTDIANLYVLMGGLGILVQSVGLKALLENVGEQRTISISFAFGAVHSLLYGLAQDKLTIFVAMALGTGVTMAFPTISALKANNVTESEQGRIQGALYSVQAIASGLGPTVMRQIYGWSQTGSGILWGPGTMFLFASFFYAIAVFYASQLKEEADTLNQVYEETNQHLDDEAVS
ncbi:hypothetical protein FisN_40Hu015 [Fistulifera solaris]|uniref:Major facilitator superfamily (MFS) profile domain-containing protein n=1 Tax=Fistulifera solaris TaxID=1519565 RepID=A0A1Z5K6W9_FISSO|nr:hypothetical protein FisN_40Hu015 [Fistulifera solaris]|eukprot:GAX21935.1 hypothetical protein FisN_40Hu015 [Fistulifera solaris]